LYSQEDPTRFGIGECAPLPGLSCDDIPEFEEILRSFCKKCEDSGKVNFNAIRKYPSILFGLETALKNYEQGDFALFQTPFSKGKSYIPINGLIWMGSYEEMVRQIEEKTALGFRCIKLKIGSLDFEKELKLLKNIRKDFSPEILTLRVDANGAFTPDTAPEKLKCLSELNIHSIEQPIKAGQWQHMAALTKVTPLPIALDEELIGIHDYRDKKQLLEIIHPHYLVLKPTLHGGFQGCREWIELAESMKIGWWMTSALESNIGLNAIAQWCATFNNSLHQGLGTGQLYTNNIETPLYCKGEQLWFNPTAANALSAHSLKLLAASCKESSIIERNPVFCSLTPPQAAGNVLSEFSKMKEISQLYETDINKQTLQLEGITYNWETLQKAITSHPASLKGICESLYEFLMEWFSASPAIAIQTSGSTGEPTVLMVKKQYLIQSAAQTCDYFKLKPGDNILLCLPLDFIAGKMMVIRALVGRLNLYVTEPDGHPLKAINTTFRFISMVPMQVHNTLQVPEESNRFSETAIILIGGSPVSPGLEKALQSFTNQIHASYGMAETLSHIAIRRINGKDASTWYTPFPSVNTSLSREGCLIVDAPMVTDKKVITNDLAKILPDGRFRILGRKDTMINTGGKKVLIESLEIKLSAVLPFPFAVSSCSDEKFGEIIVLVSERLVDKKQLREALPAWQVPKRIIQVKQLPYTKSGKINRAALKKLIEAPRGLPRGISDFQ